MTTRLRDSERTKLIAEFIRTGQSPAGYEITVIEGSKYKVRRIKSKQEQLEAKRERLKKQLETIENELKTIECERESKARKSVANEAQAIEEHSDQSKSEATEEEDA